jgi:hypothetical protein
MQNSKKISSEKEFPINLNPFTQKRNYGFTYQNFENDGLISTIHYETEIICDENDYNYAIFEINRKQIFIDNQAPNLKMEQLAHSCAQAIFPIRVKTNEEGEIVQIINHEAIKQRWTPIKENLLNYFRGEVVQEIILKTEMVLLNQKQLQKSIEKNWFFHLFFKPLYKNYNQNKPTVSIWESPVFGNQNIKYEVHHMVEENYSPTNKIFINAKGKSIDERTIQEVLDGYNYPKSKMAGIASQPLESEMEVQYKLYGEDRSIFSIISTFKTQITEQKHKTIQAEIYHLPENSSYRPESRKSLRENLELFKSYQNKEHEDIIDIFAKIKNAPLKTRIKPENSENRISLLVDDDEPIPEKNNFWTRTKSILNKNK